MYKNIIVSAGKAKSAYSVDSALLYPHVHMHVDGAIVPPQDAHAVVFSVVQPIARHGMSKSDINLIADDAPFGRWP